MRKSYASKAKFTFKRKEGKTRAATNHKPVDSPSMRQSTVTPSTYLSLSSYHQSHLSFSSLPNSQQIPESDMTIADLDGCIVDLVGQSMGPVLTAIHIRNVSNTILILPLVKGSVLLHDLRRCVVIVGCHQVFRPLFLLFYHFQPHLV
jgi:tubulin-specific chaperone C